MNAPTLVTLRSGIKVISKPYKGEPYAVTYANETQATKKAESIPGYRVFHIGRPFYVGPTDQGGSMSENYQSAMEKSRIAIAAYRKAQADYRTMKIGDDAFLMARDEYDKAMAEYDAAFAKEAA